VLSRFTFMDFEADLREFLGRHGIAQLPHPVTPPWRNLELAYCELIRDQTWDYTNTRDPTRWVNRVQVRMRDRRMDGSLPANDQPFPFFQTAVPVCITSNRENHAMWSRARSGHSAQCRLPACHREVHRIALLGAPTP